MTRNLWRLSRDLQQFKSQCEDTLFEQSIQKMLDKSGTRRRPNITRKRLKTFFGASPRGIAKFSSNQNNWKKLKWKR